MTIPINTKDGLNNARERKQAKENYIYVLGDLKAKGYIVKLETVEIGSLGHYPESSLQSILADMSQTYFSLSQEWQSHVHSSFSTVTGSLSGFPHHLFVYVYQYCSLIYYYVLSTCQSF